MSFSFSNPKKENNNLNEEQRLCNSIQEMGTTFIKLGQFLSTRPDIIGIEIAKKLENLQDKLPPFSSDEAKKIMKKEKIDFITYAAISNKNLEEISSKKGKQKASEQIIDTLNTMVTDGSVQGLYFTEFVIQ